MASMEPSEKRRLAPVICTILKLTNQEKKAVDNALAASDVDDTSVALASLGALTSSFGSFFGYADTNTTQDESEESPTENS